MITTLFGGMASFLAAWMTKKAAFAVAAVATFTALTVALVGVLSALVASLVGVFPEASPVVLSLVWAATPDIVPTGIAACLTCDAAVAVYRWNVHGVKLAAFTS